MHDKIGINSLPDCLLLEFSARLPGFCVHANGFIVRYHNFCLSSIHFVFGWRFYFLFCIPIRMYTPHILSSLNPHIYSYVYSFGAAAWSEMLVQSCKISNNDATTHNCLRRCVFVCFFVVHIVFKIMLSKFGAAIIVLPWDCFR